MARKYDGMECAGFVYSSGWGKVTELCEFYNESSVSMQWGNSLISLGTISFSVSSLFCRVTSVVKLVSLGHIVKNCICVGLQL